MTNDEEISLFVRKEKEYVLLNEYVIIQKEIRQVVVKKVLDLYKRKKDIL